MSSQWAKGLHTICSHRSLCLWQQWKHHHKSHSASSVSTDHLFPLARHTRHLSISQQVCRHCPLQSWILDRSRHCPNEWRNLGLRKLRRLVTAIVHQEQSVIDFPYRHQTTAQTGPLGEAALLTVSSPCFTNRNGSLINLSSANSLRWCLQQRAPAQLH